MAQIFDSEKGCLPVTAYVVFVKEDTTITVGDDACVVTITAEQGQGIVITDASAKLTLSSDTATHEQLPKFAPLSLGKGQGGNISPAAKAFLTWVTNGKISFSADGRLQIATSVDATGTFNHDGYASNYTKTIGSTKYTTTVNANEVIVKKSVAGVETVLMHLHDGVLELGGARVLSQLIGTLVSGAAAELQHNGFYSLPAAADDGFDLSLLTLAAPPVGGVTTARIAITLTGAGHVGAQVCPVGWNWVNEYQGEAPVLDGGRVYYVAVDRYGDYINAHVSHSNAI